MAEEEEEESFCCRVLCYPLRAIVAYTLREEDGVEEVRRKAVVVPIGTANCIALTSLAVFTNADSLAYRIGAGTNGVFSGVLVGMALLWKQIPLPAVELYLASCAVSVILCDWANSTVPGRLRSWGFIILVMDLCLVLQARDGVWKVVMLLMVCWTAVRATETAWGWGLTDPEFLGQSVETRREATDCADPPCPLGVVQGAVECWVILFIYTCDFAVTRGFTRGLREEQEMVGASVAATEQVAIALALYRVDEAQYMIDSADAEALPPRLRDAFRQLLSNLREYRCFLPQAVLSGAGFSALMGEDSQDSEASGCGSLGGIGAANRSGTGFFTVNDSGAFDRRSPTQGTSGTPGSPHPPRSPAFARSGRTHSTHGSNALALGLEQRNISLVNINVCYYHDQGFTNPAKASSLVSFHETYMTMIVTAAGTRGMVDLVFGDKARVTHNAVRHNDSHRAAAAASALQSSSVRTLAAKAAPHAGGAAHKRRTSADTVVSHADDGRPRRGAGRAPPIPPETAAQQLFGVKKLELSVGVVTGSALVGNVGARELRCFNVISTLCSWASALERLSAQGLGACLADAGVAEEALDVVRRAVPYRLQHCKHRKEMPVRVWALEEPVEPVLRDLAHARPAPGRYKVLNGATEAYLSGDWAAAALQLQNVPAEQARGLRELVEAAMTAGAALPAPIMVQDAARLPTAMRAMVPAMHPRRAAAPPAHGAVTGMVGLAAAHAISRASLSDPRRMSPCSLATLTPLPLEPGSASWPASPSAAAAAPRGAQQLLTTEFLLQESHKEEMALRQRREEERVTQQRAIDDRVKQKQLQLNARPSAAPPGTIPGSGPPPKTPGEASLQALLREFGLEKWRETLMNHGVKEEADLAKIEQPEDLPVKMPMFARRKIVREYAMMQQTKTTITTTTTTITSTMTTGVVQLHPSPQQSVTPSPPPPPAHTMPEPSAPPPQPLAPAKLAPPGADRGGGPVPNGPGTGHLLAT